MRRAKLGLDSFEDDVKRIATAIASVTGAAGPHNILSATHSDAATVAVLRGALVYGDDTPEWELLPVGAAGQLLHTDGVDVAWYTLLATDLPAHNLLSAQHGDTLTAAVSRGSLVYGNVTPAWAELVHPAAAGYALTTDANDVLWDQTPTWTGLHTFDGGWLIGAGQTGDLNGVADALVIDADGDTTISAPVDDRIDFEIGGADDFTMTANSLNVLSGSTITMADDTWIGLGAAAGRLIFDSTPAPDEIRVSDANLDLNANDFILDADGDSYLHAAADDHAEFVLATASGRLDININGADDFTFTANAFNVAVGSAIVMGDDCTIGQAAGPLLTFDDTSNILTLTGGDFHLSDGIADRLKLRRSGDVAATESDIYAQSQLGIAAEFNAHIFIDADNDSTNSYFAIWKDAENMAAATEIMRVTEAALMLINDTSCADSTIGIVIDQGANDDGLLVFKSSDVAHGMTDLAETDSYMVASKWTADEGGARFIGYTENEEAVVIQGRYTTANTTKTTAANGAITILAQEKSGTGIGNCTADTNMFVVKARRGGANEAVVIIDEDGDIYYDGALNNYDTEDDTRALADLGNVLSGAWHNVVEYNRDKLAGLGIISIAEDDRIMVSNKKLTALFLGAFGQLYARLEKIEGAIV